MPGNSVPMMDDGRPNFDRDIARISGIAAVPTILDVVSKTTGMGFTAVARVTEDRWITCASRDELAFGLKPGDELKVESTICHEIRQSRTAVIIDDVSKDAVYCSHHTPAQYGLQSYISVPIILADGSFFGTLCAIDPKPHILNTPEVIGMFKLFAELIAFHLDAADKVGGEREPSSCWSRSRQNCGSSSLPSSVTISEIRLRRSPAACACSARKSIPRARAGSSLLQGSVSRMSGLIDNVMDLARTRLGGGMPLKLREEPLEPLIRQIVSEFQNVHPDRVITSIVDVPGSVKIDTRPGWGSCFPIFSGNALSYGDPHEPIKVVARTAGVMASRSA